MTEAPLDIDPQMKKLPTEVKFCARCVMSNQRPRIGFDAEGVCSACRYCAKKDKTIDWDLRQRELRELLDKHRSKAGTFDVVVPCSGGKDSSMIAHKLKYVYGMHPLCVTFSPPIYSDIGFKNLRRFIDAGFDHMLVSPNGRVNRALTKAGFIHLGDHNEIFDHGQMSVPFSVALNYGIKLVMYGENGEAEYGGSTKNADRPAPAWDDFEKMYYSTGLDHLIETAKEAGYFGKEPVPAGAFDIYRMPPVDKLEKLGLEMHWFAYYQKWVPQEHFYYASKHTGFEANPEGRTEGTYSKYAQLDDATDSFLYYMMFVKFGFGRATSDAAHEIRDGHITREEGVALVKRYDGEFPKKSFPVFLDYVGMTEAEFHPVVDKFRLPHIWKKDGGQWRLRKTVYE